MDYVSVVLGRAQIPIGPPCLTVWLVRYCSCWAVTKDGQQNYSVTYEGPSWEHLRSSADREGWGFEKFEVEACFKKFDVAQIPALPGAEPGQVEDGQLP